MPLGIFVCVCPEKCQSFLDIFEGLGIAHGADPSVQESVSLAFRVWGKFQIQVPRLESKIRVLNLHSLP